MMKKLFVTMMLCVMTIAASAQVKSIDVKADLRGDFGLGAGVTCGLMEKLDLAPRFNYYFGKDTNYYTIDADVHYNFEVADEFTVFPIAGLAFLHAPGSSKLGINLGVGGKYQMNDKLGLFAEAKYQIINGHDDTYFSIGVNIGI